MEASFTATSLAKNEASFFLKFLFSQHDSPRVLLSDNGFNFTAHVVTKLSNLIGMCTTFVAHTVPPQMGLSSVQQCVGFDPEEDGFFRFLLWPRFLEAALLAYCIIYHGSLASHLSKLFRAANHPSLIASCPSSIPLDLALLRLGCALLQMSLSVFKLSPLPHCLPSPPVKLKLETQLNLSFPHLS